VDRVTSGERSVEMDDILNILDGIDTKSANIITVLTTNDLMSINPAMLRPGRLDAVIDVTPPDAEAVEKLLRLYGGETIDADTDLSQVSQILNGNIPAVIAEVVKRAKLAQLRLQPVGERVAKISEAALLDAATTMQAQVKLLRDRCAPALVPPTIDSVLAGVVRLALEAPLQQIEDLTKKVGEVHQSVC
jgi:transitional endoplasmic reticulum ATPase